MIVCEDSGYRLGAHLATWARNFASSWLAWHGVREHRDTTSDIIKWKTRLTLKRDSPGTIAAGQTVEPAVLCSKMH